MVEHRENIGFVMTDTLFPRNHYYTKTRGSLGESARAAQEAVIVASRAENYNRHMKYLTGCQYYFINESTDVSLVNYLKPGAASA